MAYVLNDAIMKLLFADIDFFQAIFLRGLVSLPPLLILALMTKNFLQKYSTKNKRLMSIRILAEIGTTVTFLTALKYMPLANVTAILQSLPLAITMAAAIFLGEKVGWRRWSAIFIGFTGVLIIVRPGLVGFSSYSLLASWLLIITAAASVTVATLLSVVAMRTGDISFVSPFRYTSLIGAIGLGILFFGEWPDGVTFMGACIIVFAGIYSIYREKILGKNS